MAEFKPLPTRIPREADLPRITERQLQLLKDALPYVREAHEKVLALGGNVYGNEVASLIQVELLDRKIDLKRTFEKREGLLRSIFELLSDAAKIGKEGGTPIDADELLGEIALEISDLVDELGEAEA